MQRKNGMEMIFRLIFYTSMSYDNTYTFRVRMNNMVKNALWKLLVITNTIYCDVYVFV